jgi:hypothetical protein
VTQTRPQTAVETPRPTRPAPARAPSPRELSAGLFRLGVVALTAGVAAYLSVAVTAWQPHEDEVLALFAGRGSLSDLYDTVFHRGGAPLHFTLAWIVAHSGGGLLGLRIVSAIFAVLSVPAAALLGARLAGRGPALAATALLAVSWALLFHGVYARMYSLFLFTSTLSYLAFLRAVERGGRRDWSLWVVAILATTATHTYGAIVLASQGVYLLLARGPVRRTVPWFGAVLVLGIPFWLADRVLAGRYDVGVGGGGAKLRGPEGVARYLFHVAGDFTAGWWWATWPILAVAAVGLVRLARTRPRSALLVAAVVVTPALVLIAARVGSPAAPETRHLIFTLPFFLALVGAGLVRTLRSPLLVLAAVAALGYGEVAWGIHKMPQFYYGEPSARVAARESASEWLAQTSRPDDVLLGYDPLFLGAWERGGDVSETVVPRADATLALSTLREAPKPLGRGVFVFDASDTNNWRRRLYVPAVFPEPAAAFEVRAFGPFLVVRTRGPVRTARGFLERASEAELVGKRLYMGDADINYATVTVALRRLER